MTKASRICSDGLYDYRGRIGAYAGRHKVFQGVLTGRSRDGIMFRGDQLRDYAIKFAWAASTESALMNLTEELEGQYKAAEQLWNGYKEKLDEFRSHVKNDVASLEASARKTTEAVHKMTRAYGEAIAQMTGPQMQQAIENAERLSAAMTALANLQSHKLVFSVTDNSSAGACQSER